MAAYLPSHKPFKWDGHVMQGTAREATLNSQGTFFYGPLYVDVPVVADLEKIYIYHLYEDSGSNLGKSPRAMNYRDA